MGRRTENVVGERGDDARGEEEELRKIEGDGKMEKGGDWKRTVMVDGRPLHHRDAVSRATESDGVVMSRPIYDWPIRDSHCNRLAGIRCRARIKVELGRSTGPGRQEQEAGSSPFELV